MDSTFDQHFYVSIGDQVTFGKTISESDVYLFAGITGDFAQIHVNAEYVKHSVFDTITVTYTIAEIDTAKQRSRSTIEARNQHGQIVAAAQHLIQWVRTTS